MCSETDEDCSMTSSTPQTRRRGSISHISHHFCEQHLKVSNLQAFFVCTPSLGRCFSVSLEARDKATTLNLSYGPRLHRALSIDLQSPVVRGSLRQQMCFQTPLSHTQGVDQCRGGKAPRMWWRFLPLKLHWLICYWQIFSLGHGSPPDPSNWAGADREKDRGGTSKKDTKTKGLKNILLHPKFQGQIYR